MCVSICLGITNTACCVCLCAVALFLQKTPSEFIHEYSYCAVITMCVSVFRNKKYNLLCTSIYACFQKPLLNCVYSEIQLFCDNKEFCNVYCFVVSENYIKVYYILNGTSRTSTRQHLATDIIVIDISHCYQYASSFQNNNLLGMFVYVCVIFSKTPIKLYSRVQLTCNL